MTGERLNFITLDGHRIVALRILKTSIHDTADSDKRDEDTGFGLPEAEPRQGWPEARLGGTKEDQPWKSSTRGKSLEK